MSGKKVAGVAFLSLFLLGAGIAAKQSLFGKQAVTYLTAEATKADLEESVLATGVLKAFKTVAVGAQVSGQLKTLHVALGDAVKKGQLLAEIDPVLQQNTLRDAEAQVENLRAQRNSKLEMLKQYNLSFQRQKTMVARDAGSRADLESAEAQLESTRYDIAALDAQIKRAVIAVDTARANLGYTQISAPMDGVVISIDTEQGQTVVSTQSATTILTLADLDTMTVKAKISEADVTRVNPGLPAYFTLLGDAEQRYHGTLRAVEPGPVSSSSSGSASSTGSSGSSSAVYYYGLFEVPNPVHRLKVSMTAQVAVVLNQARAALCIPVVALGERLKDGRCTVRVLKGEQAENRAIRTGIGNNVLVQVLDGLRPGEKVVVGDSSSVPQTTASSPMGPPPGGGRH